MCLKLKKSTSCTNFTYENNNLALQRKQLGPCNPIHSDIPACISVYRVPVLTKSCTCICACDDNNLALQRHLTGTLGALHPHTEEEQEQGYQQDACYQPTWKNEYFKFAKQMKLFQK